MKITCPICKTPVELLPNGDGGFSLDHHEVTKRLTSKKLVLVGCPAGAQSARIVNG